MKWCAISAGRTKQCELDHLKVPERQKRARMTCYFNFEFCHCNMDRLEASVGSWANTLFCKWYISVWTLSDHLLWSITSPPDFDSITITKCLLLEPGSNKFTFWLTQSLGQLSSSIFSRCQLGPIGQNTRLVRTTMGAWFLTLFNEEPLTIKVLTALQLNEGT